MLAQERISKRQESFTPARQAPSGGTAAKATRLLAYARPHWRALILLGLGTATAAVLTALQPWPLKLLVDSVLGGDPLPAALEAALATSGLASSRGTLLVLVVVGGLILFALTSMLQAAMSWGWALVGRRMVFGLAGAVFAQLQRRSLAYHGRTPVGETIARVTGDSWSLQVLVQSLLFGPAEAALTIAAMAVLMAQLDLQLMAVSLVAAPATVAASRLLGGRLRSMAETRRRLKGDIHAHIHQTLTGMPIVQAYGQEDREQLRFEDYADSMVRVQQRGAIIGGVNRFGPGFVTAVAHAVVLGLGALRVLDGAMTVGTLLVFVAYLRTLQGQVKTLAGIYPTLQQHGPSIDRVDELLRTPPEVADRPGAVDLPPVKGEVAFESVDYHYDAGAPVLRGISLRVDPGQTVALVGATGAGKSTLVALVARFFDPVAGRVLIDGFDLRQVRLASLRRQVAHVLQEPFIAPVSVAANIAYGRPDASMAEIEAAAWAANAHEFIMRLPQGYDSVLHERGASLSGGERQRLAIARALLKDAPILILDEPTSALDAGTEALIMEALGRLRRGRTSFIIAHRLSTVRDADVVVVLDHGRIAEIGAPADLLRRPSLFARFRALAAEPATAALGEGAEP